MTRQLCGRDSGASKCFTFSIYLRADNCDVNKFKPNSVSVKTKQGNRCKLDFLECLPTGAVHLHVEFQNENKLNNATVADALVYE